MSKMMVLIVMLTLIIKIGVNEGDNSISNVYY